MKIETLGSRAKTIRPICPSTICTAINPVQYFGKCMPQWTKFKIFLEIFLRLVLGRTLSFRPGAV